MATQAAPIDGARPDLRGKPSRRIRRYDWFGRAGAGGLVVRDTEKRVAVLRPWKRDDQRVSAPYVVAYAIPRRGASQSQRASEGLLMSNDRLVGCAIRREMQLDVQVIHRLVGC